MIDRIIEEINVCFNSNCYLAALNTALTLPDICGKAEFPKIRDNGKRYKRWYNKYILRYEKSKSPFNDINLDGNMVWDLRNNCLHQATFSIDNEKIKFEDYELVITNPNRSVLFSGYNVKEEIIDKETNRGRETNSKSHDNQKNIIKRFFSISLIDLIFKICSYAKKYYNENKHKFDFLKYKVVTVDYNTRNTFKIKQVDNYEDSFKLEKERTKSKWYNFYEG